MPTKKKPLRDLPKIPKELLEQFGEGLMTAEAIEDASAAFKKALIERALSAELGHHLGYPPGAQRPEDEINQRNGKTGKTGLTGDGPLRLEIPRYRPAHKKLTLSTSSSRPSTSVAQLMRDLNSKFLKIVIQAFCDENCHALRPMAS